MTLEQFLDMTPCLWFDLLDTHMRSLKKRARRGGMARETVIAENADELPQGVL